MEKHIIEDIEVIFDHGGLRDWSKYTFPAFYGLPVIIRWRQHEFHFNHLGQIRRLYCHARYWPTPQEILKRTITNDWILMSFSEYQTTYSLIKSYYAPLTNYHYSPLFSSYEKPLKQPHIIQALNTFDELIERVREILVIEKISGRVGEFLEKVAVNDRLALTKEAKHIHKILGGRLYVLPPDTIDVEYEVLPLMISDGCSGECTFCKFKKNSGFKVRDKENITSQITALANYFGQEINNYNSIVLGQNDALSAGAEIIEYTALHAYQKFHIENSYHHRSNLFLFGSVQAFLKATELLFSVLESLPFTNIYINIGLESAHQATLEFLGKSQTATEVIAAFEKMQEINKGYNKVNISCNFVLGDELPLGHIEAIEKLINSVKTRTRKGTVFISPLENHSSPGRTRENFFRLQRAATAIPVYLYLVQRL